MPKDRKGRYKPVKVKIMKFLNETQDTRINDEQEATAFFICQNEADRWQLCFTEELQAMPLDNIPILMDSVRNLNRIPDEVSDSSILETMETSKISLLVPEENGYKGYPVGDTAWLTIFQRAGYQQATVLTSQKDKASQKQMSPFSKAQVLNMGFNCFKNSSLLLIRDEKIRAALSDDYSPLPFSMLMSELKVGLAKSFSNVTFVEASANHYFSTVIFKLSDVEIERAIRDLFMKNDINVKSISIACQLTSSDVGASGANLYPFVCINGLNRAIGKPISLAHKGGHTIEDFKKNVDLMYSCFKDATTALEKLSTLKLKHPKGAFIRIAKNLSLQKKKTLETAESFEKMYDSPSGLDLYWKIYELFDDINAEANGLPLNVSINFEEGLARIISNGIDNFDLPFEWD